jgi:type IV pilus assembly protein PilV
MNMNPIRATRGFTLIEVMVAVVIFSIGLLGLALLLSSSVKSNHVGYQHTQASFAAESILDRMRANIPGVWSNAYNSTFSAATTVPTDTCDAASPCTPAQIAARDGAAWGQLLGQVLPASSGTILCTRNAGTIAPDATQMLRVPIYGGTCLITISWTEQSETSTAGGVTQSYQWVVQP